MNKLNFDLKLEVFHRTQQMKILEQKLERMAEMEEQLAYMDELEAEVQDLRTAERDNQILRESNEQLRSDLDKRDLAVTEAVDLICQLERKIDVLENGGGRTSKMSMSRPPTADGSSEALTPKARTMVDIPERVSSKRNSRNSSVMNVAQRQTSSELRKLSKAPSFLRADNKSTATLRSLYEPGSNESRTELTKSESFHTMTDINDPESPRLSVLSECSELNPFDTPTQWDDFDRIEIPLRKASSTTGSLDSYVPPCEREESKEDQIDRWIQSREEMNQTTIITRRRNRASSDASKAAVIPSLAAADLYANKPRGRGRLDASLFGGMALPPTPDTMSTAYVVGTNRSNGSNASNGSVAARKSHRKIEQDPDPFFTGRPINRPHSAEEIASRRSFNSEVTDSMQTNYSDITRPGGPIAESPTMLPSFNTVSSKASELLGPGSPNNPAIEGFGDILRGNANKTSTTPTINRVRNPPNKAMTPEPKSKSNSNGCDASPPLTPQDWVAAAKQGPPSRKETPRAASPDQTELSPRNGMVPATFDDDTSIVSVSTEVDSPGIPTLDMTTLDILEQPLELPQADAQPEADPEPRRRISFRPPFFSRSSNQSRHLQASPMIPNDFDEDDEDGAPSPIIPKSRTMGGGFGRPASQLYTNPNELYSSLQICSEEPSTVRRGLPHSLTESTMADYNGSATISGRPSTSHGAEHKRRSSLGIFGWMKGKITDSGADKSEPRPPSRLAFEAANGVRMISRAETPDSFDAPVVRPHSEMAIYDDFARRPRYMGRRARRG
jgi:hypothetical protein